MKEKSVPLDDIPDEVLLQRSGSGDRVAFEQIYDRHVRAVYWQAHRVVRDAALAEEVSQDAFVTLWEKSRSVRIVDESILPWLMVTARFIALNTHRRHRREADRSSQIDQDVEDPTSDVERVAVASEVQDRIDDAVSRLSVLDQRLYGLCIEGDHPYEAAARELGVSHGSVRNRLSRVRAQLRSDLRAVRETS
ncbi:MAG: sigma-70 family RNA polymerase sigma factor [Aeromicrobium sp.]|uniref:RNA polymerase sigma factor n=1 Tax=Aeromicrobium sp. TaxID=1871063 RepID=UPI003C455CE3